MTEFYVFTRRTPRGLAFIASTSRPMRSHRAGKPNQKFLNWTEMHDDHRDAAIARGVINHVRAATDRKTLTVDLARVAADYDASGYIVEHVADSPLYKESLKITRKELTQ